MTTGFLWDERYAWHDAGPASSNRWAEPWPAFDRPEAKRRLRGLTEASGLLAQLAPIAARPASDEELLRFHDADYLKKIAEMSAAGGGEAGEAATFGPNGDEVARLAAGGCLAATDAVLNGEVENAYALVRPCGHHAEPDRGRGFCIFGNVALAVHHARAMHNVSRVAVIDWDVHHGNGTQMAFYDDPDVLTISLHQDGYYPVDSGRLDETGVGAGNGFNINLPLPPGSGHGAYIAAFEKVVTPAVDRFMPDLIFVACGFDAAMSDPLGRMLCHRDTFREMTRATLALADTHCQGRLVMCQEGGYAPSYVPFCGLAVIEELSGIRTEVEDPLLDWYSAIAGQKLQPAQEQAIDAAARQAGLTGCHSENRRKS
ncbi:class II histone deacetylase [Leisingera methylohalidivorans]|uniref:Histone deacetylase domain-containing protein n=1 Tax=Leisingera methylohalidivorans DSM 14336 TaxID=999552 RepID=V9W3E4_9RHOB|nr:class II histone deacetylase [Leisingera methylohalidivorans]AHD03672.1 hypothetical protein METH_22850 [Leisingera methylohalidivorans DSM 14336]